MSRYRPPSARSSPYITEQGYRDLRGELDGLWQSRREVVRALSAAAAEGDRSENAEYIYRKKQLREMDRRIGYIQRRLPALKVVKDAPPTDHKVFFGAWVTLADDAGDERRVRIVGSDEIDPTQGFISVDSPMARALLGRAVDDEVTVITPQGESIFHVIEVSYG